MIEVTVNVPNVGLEAVFSFKEPLNTYLKHTFNLNSSSMRLKVVSVISMTDTIRSDLRDPYTTLYEPAGLTEVDYKVDLLDDVPVISFKFDDDTGVERYARCPLSYIESISSASSVEYMNKLIVLDLNQLPKDLDLSVFFDDLNDFVETRVGVTPVTKQVSVGDISLVAPEEHETRETIRENLVSVYKTQSIKLQEMSLAHSQLLNRLTELGISLAPKPPAP